MALNDTMAGNAPPFNL